MKALILLVVVAAACGEPAPEPDEPIATESTPDMTVMEEDVSGPTFHTDIRPILERSCLGCHDGTGVAPHDFRDLETVQALGPLMVAEIRAGKMPPWAMSDNCGSFRGDVRPTGEQLDTLEAWLDTETPAGEAPVAAEEPIETASFETAFTLEPGVGYQVDGATTDDYRCFVLEPDIDAPTFVTGMRLSAENLEVIHHVLVYSISDTTEEERLRTLDAESETPGYPCFGGPGTNSFNLVAGWAPGQDTVRLPANTGIKITPGHKLVTQIHYNGSGSGQTQLEFSADDGVQEGFAVLVGDTNMVIPAGNPEARSLLEFSVRDIVPLPVPITLHAVFPHMHLLGRRLTVTRVRGGESECLADADQYDFNWQRFYEYVEPVRLEPDDRIRLECLFDTTGADGPVRWGEQTSDEMCLVIVYVTL